MWITYCLSLLLRLGIAHAVTDVVLQDSQSFSMPRRKQPSPGDDHWPYWLLAHGLLNGAGVYWATGSSFLGLLETVVHTGVDYTNASTGTEYT